MDTQDIVGVRRSVCASVYKLVDDMKEDFSFEAKLEHFRGLCNSHNSIVPYSGCFAVFGNEWWHCSSLTVGIGRWWTLLRGSEK
ncbi:hypothetical protein [Cryobacterium sp. Y82]|uniref:hypothetical protein n=1 Tax=Cryobacterium sp. Y82 TaxID=2045017 RepID=UPI0011B01DB6|nr:hypothetical protein [Cryobacterium sp. Y82]